MRHLSLYAFLLASTVIGWEPISALAQNAPRSSGTDLGTNASPLDKPVQTPSKPYPDSGTEGGYFFNLRPLGKDLGTSLADQGIFLTGRTLQQAIGLNSGGLKQGSFYEGYNTFGVDLDMNRIAGIKGGSFHILFNDLAGLRPQNFSGSLLVFNRAWAYTAGARLNEFSYEQSFADGRVDIRVGRLPVGTEFDFSSLYCEFIYGLCATPTAFSSGKGYQAYLTASTAGVAKIDLTHHFYFNAGIYEDEPSLALAGHTGLPGDDWAPSKIRGATIPMQFGYRTGLKDDPYPRAYSIGGMIDTGDYNDPLYNYAGLNRALSGGTARLNHGKSSLWLQAEQTVWRPDFATARSLVLFGGANFQTSGEISVQNAVFGGLSYRGPLAERPNDSINFLAHMIDLSNAYNTYENSSLAKRGINQRLSSREAYLEINYGISLAPGVYLKPSFDYIWNPDQTNLALPVATDRHAVFVGLSFSALLNDTFGLPRLSGL